MTRRGVLFATASAAGLALFVIGWLAGWDRIAPLDDDLLGLGPVAGTGSFGGVITSDSRLEWATLLLAIALVVGLATAVTALVKPRWRRYLASGLLATVGAWGLGLAVVWRIKDRAPDYELAAVPWTLSVVGASLLLVAGLMLTAPLRHIPKSD